jgi:putative hydrolase of the HAD superfamily
VEVLLFDLGGVAIEIDLAPMLDYWQPYSTLSPAELRSRLRIDEPYRQHERGEIDAGAYMRHLAEVFEIRADVSTVAAGWNAMLVKPVDATLALIARMRRQLPCCAFSNTSAIHRDTWSARFPELDDAFDRLFLSFELGLRKPDTAAFEAVVEEIGKPPGSILFFDDTAENIDAARSVGLESVLVRGPRDVADALVRLGLLDAGWGRLVDEGG